MQYKLCVKIKKMENIIIGGQPFCGEKSGGYWRRMVFEESWFDKNNGLLI